MRVDLIDRLRCPSDHADTWLVAAATRTEQRTLMEATLGCPECKAEFELRAGELWFGARVESAPMSITDDEGLRAAALLRLEERGLYLLDGAWGSLAHALQAMLDVDLLLADPPVDSVAGQGTLRGVPDRWPFAGASLHGLALGLASDVRAADAVRVLRPRGRLVAPVATAVPVGVTELARDDRHWVAEKAADVVTLGRAKR